MSKESVRAEIQSASNKDGQLTCAAAHKLAEQLNVSPAEIGNLVNEIDVRISRCQLGFFGYAPKKGMPGYKIVTKLDTLPEPVATEVRNATQQGKISCLEVWRIAEKHDVKRPDMGNIVETLDIKVTPCQLGCF